MPDCLFVSDLHGKVDSYRKLFRVISEERPSAVFIGGDILPSGLATALETETVQGDFIIEFLEKELLKLRSILGSDFPRILLILGNDDGRFEETAILDAATQGIWEYIHFRRVDLDGFPIYGYCYVPPTPFILKDWERYDLSRYVDPGCVSPEEGWRSVPISHYEKKFGTIKRDLIRLVGDDGLDQAIFLFHSPPYDTNLDVSDREGRRVEGVPLDAHLGSIAIRRFIELCQPLVTLHGHVHEAARVSGKWFDRIGRTWCFTAAHDGPQLSLIRFNPRHPEKATRELI